MIWDSWWRKLGRVLGYFVGNVFDIVKLVLF